MISMIMMTAFTGVDLRVNGDLDSDVNLNSFLTLAFQGTMSASAFDSKWIEKPVARKLTYATRELRNCTCTEYDGFRIYTRDDTKQIVAFYSDRNFNRGRSNPAVNGKIVDSVVPYKLSDKNADLIAQKVYNSAGYSGELLIRSRKPNEGNQYSSVELQYLPTVEGIPYESRFTDAIELDQETGELVEFGAPSQFLPKPPQILVPKVSKGDAEWAGAMATAANFESTLLPGGGIQTTLCLWKPSGFESTSHSKRWPSATDLRASRNDEAILAYEMQFKDPRFGEKSGIPNVFYFAYVDAIDGRVVQIDRISGDAFRGGGGTQSPTTTPLPSGQRTWKVGSKGGNWSGFRTGKFEEVSSQEFKPQANVLLATHNFAATVEWDGARKLVRFGKTVYRPTGQFLNAFIQKAKPPKV